MRLIVFDLDGTLTKSPNIWRHIHDELGTWKYAKVFAQKYANGEISYRKWADLDCSLWKGIRLAKILGAMEKIKYFNGAADIIRNLKEVGMKVAIVSAGISLLADRVGRELGADIVVSNQLLHSDEVLTGEINTKVSVDNKTKIIKKIASSLKIPMSEVIVVGDNVFDMPQGAGLKIAFNPKTKEAEDVADFVVNSDDLKDVLKLILSKSLRGSNISHNPN